MSDKETFSDISLRLLEIFAAMMRCSTTVETAEHLKISQPAVSSSLRQLETQLGITLFTRTGRRLQPTPEAQELYSEIQPMFGIVRSFTTRAQELRIGRRGRLRVMATPPLGYSVGPVALRNLTASRPEATISYDVRRLENVVQAVSTGQADIGLVLNAERIETVNSDLLQRRNMVVLMPEDHPLASSEAVTPESLMPYPMIGIDVASQLGRLLKVGFDVSGVAYAPRIDVRYCQTAAALVASGMGVTVVDPYSAAPYLGRGLITRPFMPVREVSAVMLTRKGVPHSAILSSFMEELRRVVETAPRGLAF